MLWIVSIVRLSENSRSQSYTVRSSRGISDVCQSWQWNRSGAQPICWQPASVADESSAKRRASSGPSV